MIYGVEKVSQKRRKKTIISIFFIAVFAIALAAFGATRLADHLHSKELNIGTIVPQEQPQNIVNNENSENQTTSEGQKKDAPQLETNTMGLTDEQWEAMSNIYSSKNEKRVFLTFDDGPSGNITPKILDILKQENVKATFFVLGTMVKSNPEMLRREYEEGHYIANHSYSHVYKQVYASSTSAFEEYEKTEKLIQEALEDENYHSNVFRFPGGSVGGYYDSIKKEAKKIFKQNKIAYLDWSALTNDAAGAKTKEDIMQTLKSTLKDQRSVVLLMHDAPNKSLTAETLPDVIAYLREQGYSFKNLYDVI